MKVELLAVHIENRLDRLAAIAELLAGNGINIRTLFFADTAGAGLLQILVNDIVRANDLLRAAGHETSRTEVLVLEVPDRPGGLATVLNSLENTALTVQYIHAYSQKSGESGLLIFGFDDPDKAANALRLHGIRILSAEEVDAL